MTTPNPPADTPEPSDDPHDLEAARKLRNEARNLRDRAKTAEDALQAANTRIEAFQRADIERAAATGLRDPADLWSAGRTVADFLDDTGELDTDKITATIGELVTDKPHWAIEQKPATPPSNRPIESLRSGASPADQSGHTPTWSDVLGPLAGPQ